MTKRRHIFGIMLSAWMAALAPAHAQDYGRDDMMGIGDNDRAIIAKYIASDYRKHCPPGLAKKHNGCMPPGQAKKYSIGRPIAENMWQTVPRALIGRIEPAPAGYRYVMVDRDVLLISEAAHKVIDAVTLLAAVKH